MQHPRPGTEHPGTSSGRRRTSPAWCGASPRRYRAPRSIIGSVPSILEVLESIPEHPQTGTEHPRGATEHSGSFSDRCRAFRDRTATEHLRAGDHRAISGPFRSISAAATPAEPAPPCAPGPRRGRLRPAPPPPAPHNGGGAARRVAAGGEAAAGREAAAGGEKEEAEAAAGYPAPGWCSAARGAGERRLGGSPAPHSPPVTPSPPGARRRAGTSSGP